MSNSALRIPQRALDKGVVHVERRVIEVRALVHQVEMLIGVASHRARTLRGKLILIEIRKCAALLADSHSRESVLPSCARCTLC